MLNIVCLYTITITVFLSNLDITMLSRREGGTGIEPSVSGGWSSVAAAV